MADDTHPLATLLTRYLAAAERLAETDPVTAAAVRREIERVRAAIEAPQHVFPAFTGPSPAPGGSRRAGR